MAISDYRLQSEKIVDDHEALDDVCQVAEWEGRTVSQVALTFLLERLLPLSHAVLVGIEPDKMTDLTGMLAQVDACLRVLALAIDHELQEPRYRAVSEGEEGWRAAK